VCSQNVPSNKEKITYNLETFKEFVKNSDAYFVGTLPCQFCDSIGIKLYLDNDSNFTINHFFYGAVKEEEFYEGNWQVDSNMLTLKSDLINVSFRIENDKLQMVDGEGFDVINEKGYTLEIYNPKAHLTFKGNYMYFADAGTFTLCKINKTYPILNNEQSFTLEKEFLNSKSTILRVEVIGKIQLLKKRRCRVYCG
jgi:hypothetical protein